MRWKCFSAAECSVGSIGKRIGLRGLSSTPGLRKAHGQVSHRMFQWVDILDIRAFGNSVPASVDTTSTSSGISPPSTELLPGQPVTAETFQEQQCGSYTSKPTRTRPPRRRQQQELLWGAPPSAEPAHLPRDEAVSTPAGFPRPSPHPSCPQQPQQQELLRGIRPAADVFTPAQQLHPSHQPQPAAAEPICEEDGHVGPVDILAQRDAVLLARIGRHRNRQIVGSIPPQAPVIPSCVAATGDSPNLRNGAEMALIPPLDYTGEGGTHLQPREAGATISSGAAESTSATGGSDGVGSGHGGDSRGPRGVVLRLRRHGSKDTAAPRRIRLPLPERPKPWAIKLLLEPMQPEQQAQCRQPQKGRGEELEQLELLAGLEEGYVADPRAVTPPPPLQEDGKGKGRQKQSGQQQKRQEGFSLGSQDMSEKNNAAGLVRRDADEPHGPEVHCEERLERQGGEQEPQSWEQGTGTVQERLTVQMQPERQQAQQQGHEQQKRRQQRRRHHHHHQPEHRQAAQTQQGQANTQVRQAGQIGWMVDPDPGRSVAAHPDGTLWSYCSPRDVGPLATRMLQVLLQPRREATEEGAQEAVMSLQQGDQKLGSEPNENYGARGSLAGGDGSVADWSDSEPSSGTCHILATGSYQTYNLLRALSYAQGALRLAAYNRPEGATRLEFVSDPATNTAGPALAFTAGDVSLSELRMYFEQTVQHSTGPTPELGRPLPPRSSRKRDDVAVDAQHGPTVSKAGTASKDGRGNTVPGKVPPPSVPLQGWPDDAEQLEPRALVSVFLVQPPLDLPYGGTVVAPAMAGGGLPALAVSTAANVDTLSRLLTARLRRHGYCCMRALGRGAASRTMEILSAASGVLCRVGLGVLAFPRMGPLGTQPRAMIPISVGSSAAAMASSPPVMGCNKVRQGASRSPVNAEPAAASATAAIAAGLDPVLMDKAPQLVLEVVLCGWSECGLPVVSERLGPPIPVPAGGAAAAAAAPPSVRVGHPGGTESGGGIIPQHGTEGRGTARWVLQSVAAVRRSDRRSGQVSAGGSPPVRLVAPPPAAASCEVRLGSPNSGPDTRTSAEHVARNVMEGRRVVLTAGGLGSLLRLPVVVFRAQGMLRELERPLRRLLVFTLHTQDTDSAATSRGEMPQGPQGGAQRQPMRQPQPQRMEQLQMPQQQRQGASINLEDVHPSEGAVDAETERRELRATNGDDSLAAEVLRVPVSALQHHLDSLPALPPEYINARSTKRHLLSYDPGHAECEDDLKGGNETSRVDQQNVEAAAAAAAEHLIQYGTAILVGTSPGSRITALLAAACVSEGFMRSAGLTVLVRVDKNQARSLDPALPHHRRQRQVCAPHNNNVKTTSTGRPPPPDCYQLLLSRMDRRVGRLQLLRPNDLAAAGGGTVDRSSASGRR
ncbi:hypothetical protein VaNZ11_014829 [Volvox africanus]|uniref:Uncharacterized protein n=1 Tax=Volvox africanus TaxID=51714 RepID=A0ABQ5SK67_9CHLO|nr:hypothetical protein VaNZ11_014829 [Volvox africanus]